MGSISFEALSSKALKNVNHLSYLEKTALKAISEEVDLPSEVQTSDLMHLANYLNEVFMANIQEADKKSENDLVELINFLLFATDWKKGSSDQSDGMSTGQKVECACDCGCKHPSLPVILCSCPAGTTSSPTYHVLSYYSINTIHSNPYQPPMISGTPFVISSFSHSHNSHNSQPDDEYSERNATREMGPHSSSLSTGAAEFRGSE